MQNLECVGFVSSYQDINLLAKNGNASDVNYGVFVSGHESIFHYRLLNLIAIKKKNIQ